MKKLTILIWSVILLSSSCQNHPFNKKPLIIQPKKMEKAFKILNEVFPINNNLIRVSFEYQKINAITAQQAIHFIVVDSNQLIKNYTYSNKIIIGPNKVNFSLKGGTIKDIQFNISKINLHKIDSISQTLLFKNTINQLVIDKTDDSDIKTWLTYKFYIGQNKNEKILLYSEYGKFIKTINI